MTNTISNAQMFNLVKKPPIQFFTPSVKAEITPAVGAQGTTLLPSYDRLGLRNTFIIYD